MTTLKGGGIDDPSRTNAGPTPPSGPTPAAGGLLMERIARDVLELSAGPFYVAGTETQKARATKEAASILAASLRKHALVPQSVEADPVRSLVREILWKQPGLAREIARFEAEKSGLTRAAAESLVDEVWNEMVSTGKR